LITTLDANGIEAAPVCLLTVISQDTLCKWTFCGVLSTIFCTLQGLSRVASKPVVGCPDVLLSSCLMTPPACQSTPLGV